MKVLLAYRFSALSWGRKLLRPIRGYCFWVSHTFWKGIGQPRVPTSLILTSVMESRYCYSFIIKARTVYARNYGIQVSCICSFNPFTSLMDWVLLFSVCNFGNYITVIVCLIESWSAEWEVLNQVCLILEPILSPNHIASPRKSKGFLSSYSI